MLYDIVLINTPRVETSKQTDRKNWRNLIPLKSCMPRLQNFLLLRTELHHKFFHWKCFSPSLTEMLTRGNVAKRKSKTRSLCVFYSEKTSCVFDQLELAERLFSKFQLPSKLSFWAKRLFIFRTMFWSTFWPWALPSNIPAIWRGLIILLFI